MNLVSDEKKAITFRISIIPEDVAIPATNWFLSVSEILISLGRLILMILFFLIIN